MDRINAANATVNRRFQDGNETTGQRATSFNATWANGIQEEMMTIIQAGGFAGNAAAYDLMMKAIVNIVHPVGNQLVMNNNTSPNALWPWQTWVEDTSGRVVVSRDPGQTEFNVLGKQGGAKTHQLTVGQLPKHRFKLFANDGTNRPELTDINKAKHQGTNGSGDSEYVINGTDVEPTLGLSSEVGNNEAHPNLQPYIVRRVWIRTA